MRESDKKIQTIFYDLSAMPGPKVKKASKPLLKAVTARIQSQEGMYRELLYLWGSDKEVQADQKQQLECMVRLVNIVAQGLIDKEERIGLKREKDLARGLAQKTAATWRQRVIEEDERTARLKDFSRITQRRVMAQHEAQALTSKPARHDKDSFRRLAVYLYDYFSALTTQPYRFMAAITGLFNLHPRDFCSECSHLHVSRKPLHRHKNQSLATMVREGTHMCKLENVLQ